MAILMWGWVHQRYKFRFRPSVWKRRYLVLTTMSIHVHKSEKGVISSLFPEHLPKVHVWSNFKSARGYTKRKESHIFMVEPKDPKIYPLKFKCVTLQDKDKWLAAIKEQLFLTTQIWSYSAQPNTTNTTTSTSTTNHLYDRQIVPVSVLDKWLDQLQVIDTSSMIQREATITLQQRNSVSSGSSLSSITAITTNRRNSLSSTITRRNSLSIKKPISVKMKKITTSYYSMT